MRSSRTRVALPGDLGSSAAAGARRARGRAAQRGRRRGPAVHAVAGLAPLRPAAALVGRQSSAAAPAGAQADRDLDAVTALFDVAEQYVDRHRGRVAARPRRPRQRAGPLPRPATRHPTSTAVAVVSAHAALGREWEFVVIAGLQEGLWPNTIPRGGVLGTQQLVDVLDGVAERATRRVQPGAAAGRGAPAADRRAWAGPAAALLVTAVDSDERRRRDAAVAVLRRARRAGHRRRDPTIAEPVRAPRVLAPAPRGRPAARGGVRTRRAPSTTRHEPVRQRNWRGWPRRACPAPIPAQWYGMTAAEHRRAAVVGRRTTS